MDKIKVAVFIVVIIGAFFATQQTNAAVDNGTSIKIDCKGFDLRYEFKTSRNNVGTPPAERILFQAFDGTGTGIYREEKTFPLSSRNVEGRIKSDWTTPPTVSPLKFQLISEEGNGLSMEVFFTKTETCKKLPSNIPTPTPYPGKPDLFVTAQARQHPLVQSNIDTYYYHLSFGNHGTNLALPPITITDTFPQGITLAGGITSNTSVICVSSGQVITCTYPYTLLPGDTGFEIYFSILATQVGTFTNTAVISSNNTDADPADNTANDIITVAPPTDVALTLTNAVMALNGDGSFTATITNVGPNPTAAPIEFYYNWGSYFVQGVSIVGQNWPCQFDASSPLIDCFRTVPLQLGEQTTITVTFHGLQPGMFSANGYTSTFGDNNSQNGNATNQIIIGS